MGVQLGPQIRLKIYYVLRAPFLADHRSFNIRDIQRAWNSTLLYISCIGHTILFPLVDIGAISSMGFLASFIHLRVTSLYSPGITFFVHPFYVFKHPFLNIVQYAVIGFASISDPHIFNTFITRHGYLMFLLHSVYFCPSSANFMAL